MEKTKSELAKDARVLLELIKMEGTVTPMAGGLTPLNLRALDLKHVNKFLDFKKYEESLCAEVIAEIINLDASRLQVLISYIRTCEFEGSELNPKLVDFLKNYDAAQIQDWTFKKAMLITFLAGQPYNGIGLSDIIDDESMMQIKKLYPKMWIEALYLISAEKALVELEFDYEKYGFEVIFSFAEYLLANDKTYLPVVVETLRQKFSTEELEYFNLLFEENGIKSNLPLGVTNTFTPAPNNGNGVSTQDLTPVRDIRIVIEKRPLIFFKVNNTTNANA